MKLFTLNQAKGRVGALEIELAEAKVKLASFDEAKIEARISAAVEAAFATVATELSEAKASAALADVNVTAIKAELEAEKAKQIDVEKEAARKGALIVASVTGIPAIEVSESETTEPGASKSVFDEYLALKKSSPTEAGAFWKANIKELRKIAS